MVPPLLRRLGLGFALAVGVTSVGGCDSGPPAGDVSGLVTLDGKPVDNGYVNLLPADGKSPSSGGEIGPDGRYRVRKASVGVMKVEIRSSKVTGKKKLYNTKDSPEQEIRQEILPTKYNNPTTLTYDVPAGASEKNWELQSK
ncbi:hypothetical protein [Limnoglobus roseus]|uniref:Carboxypeptidase regulatory-like domain-containing protein n=1 Tax=Limnoglobus roseus TaxID=2598579 RepID=A0A5C1A6A8_9BACT|nr:hypothetical protein [Limnoglobus roseus]QEL13372.1 carboxypeptidase regulatory-like domain-containing protein [Limnoglobus roseus]